MVKQKIYEKIHVDKIEVDYSPVIRFETSHVNMDEEKALTKRNQLEKSNNKQQIWCWCGSIKHLIITTRD